MIVLHIWSLSVTFCILYSKCKSKAFYLHLIYKHDIPLKLTIANGLDIHGKQHFHGGYILYLYGVICLYYYRLIYLYRYCVICLLLYCMLTVWGYYFLYIYILFLFLTSTSIFYDSGCRLSIIWLFTVQRYGGSVRYQTPGDALFG